MFVSLGDLTLDILVKPDKRAPGSPPDSPGSVTMTSGGHAANFAVWISRLGADARFIGKVGNDPAAALLEWDLLKEGVLPEIIHAPGSTATLVTTARASGHVDQQLPDRGVAVALKPDEIEDRWLLDARWLHLPATAFMALPLASAAGRAVRLARDAGAKISVDLCSVREVKAYGAAKLAMLLKTILPDIIFATQEEAVLFSSGALGELASVAVLKFADGGCGISDEAGYREFEPPDRVRMIDASGGGEAFAAAWCRTFLDSGNLEQAAHAGMLLLRRVVSHHGTRPKVDLKGVVPHTTGRRHG